MKTGLSASDVGIGTMSQKRRVVSLLPTEPPLMTDVNVECVVAENASTNDVDLRATGNNAYEQTLNANEIHVHGVLHSVLKGAGGCETSDKDIGEGVPAVICEPTYITCRIA